MCYFSVKHVTFFFNTVGAGFGSKRKYMFQKVTIQLKLVEGDSARTEPFLCKWKFYLFFFKELICS